MTFRAGAWRVMGSFADAVLHLRDNLAARQAALSLVAVEDAMAAFGPEQDPNGEFGPRVFDWSRTYHAREFLPEAPVYEERG